MDASLPMARPSHGRCLLLGASHSQKSTRAFRTTISGWVFMISVGFNAAA
ncbi:hypothetical protein A2U01_0042011, partial [Trifolium medium]|nr:hypothetical protein [Trifolium medium]